MSTSWLAIQARMELSRDDQRLVRDVRRCEECARDGEKYTIKYKEEKSNLAWWTPQQDKGLGIRLCKAHASMLFYLLKVWELKRYEDD